MLQLFTCQSTMDSCQTTLRRSPPPMRATNCLPWEKLPQRQQCQNCPECRKGRISFLKGNISKLAKIACMKEQNNFSLFPWRMWKKRKWIEIINLKQQQCKTYSAGASPPDQGLCTTTTFCNCCKDCQHCQHCKHCKHCQHGQHCQQWQLC